MAYVTRTATASETPFKGSTVAYVALALFAVLFVVFAGMNMGAIPGTAAMPLNYLAFAWHIAGFFLVAVLPLPLWARTAGFLWAGLDATVDIMNINGVAFATTWAIRLGSHIPFALFLVGASWRAKGAFRGVGYLAAITLAAYSLVAPWAPATALMVPMVLLMAWLVLAARELRVLEQAAPTAAALPAART